MSLPQVTTKGLYAYIDAQGVADRKDAAVVCPMCKTVQSLRSFEREGVATEVADKAIGFNCIGRYCKGKSAFGKEGYGGEGPGCDYTLGGLFRFPAFEVIVGENRHPFFQLATPEQAQSLAAM